MKRLNLIFLVTCLLLSALVIMQGCKQKSDALPSTPQEYAHENHHDEEGEGGDLSMSLEKITEAECEHGIPAFQCNECRYEVGVVKLDKTLIKQTEKPGSALVGTARVMTGAQQTVLNVTGEIRLNEDTAAHISPKTEGVIYAVNVDFGTRVKKNDILFAIESPTLAFQNLCPGKVIIRAEDNI